MSTKPRRSYQQDTPEGFGEWPVEAKVSWITSNRTQAGIVGMILNSVGAEIPDEEWPRADMATLNLLAHAYVAIEHEYNSD